MKKVMSILIALALMSSASCTTNGIYDPTKTWMLVGATVVGGVVASQSGDDHSHGSNCYFVIRPDSSYEVCR